ncbi:MAG TPA: histidine phosphatase family protein [Propionibacteriaceae bacterium]
MDTSGTKTLVLVRHAKSSWDLDVDDQDRPLSGRGRRDAKAIGELLIAESLRPDLVLCSTAERTRQTWQGAVDGGADAVELRYEPKIYHAWVPELTALVRAVPDEVGTLLLVGHAPGIPDLVEHLAVREHESDLWTRLDAKFPTAAVAVLAIRGSWADVGKGRARLAAYTVARSGA